MSKWVVINGQLVSVSVHRMTKVFTRKEIFRIYETVFTWNHASSLSRKRTSMWPAPPERTVSKELFSLFDFWLFQKNSLKTISIYVCMSPNIKECRTVRWDYTYVIVRHCVEGQIVHGANMWRKNREVEIKNRVVSRCGSSLARNWLTNISLS